MNINTHELFVPYSCKFVANNFYWIASAVAKAMADFVAFARNDEKTKGET